MKTYQLKFWLITLLALSIFYSCKKTDTQFTPDQQQGMEKLKQEIQEKINKGEGMGQVYTINKKMPVALEDMNGRIITKQELINNNLTSTCAGDIPESVDLTQYVRLYVCPQSGGPGSYGFRIEYEYKVSWNNNVVKQNPTNPALITKGRVKISSGASTVFDKTAGCISIKDIGPDGANPGNDFYVVKFLCTDIILSTYIDDPATYTVRLGATFASDCSSLDQYGLVVQDPAGWGFTPGNGYPACSRNEQGYFSSTAIAHRLSFVAWDVFFATCDYNGTFIKPDLQEGQYSLNNGSTWNNFQNYTATSTWGIFGSKFLRGGDFAQSPVITAGTYNIVIRYKNWKYNSTPPPTWTIPTTTTACRTYGNDNDNSFAYEYYPNTVIN